MKGFDQASVLLLLASLCCHKGSCAIQKVLCTCTELLHTFSESCIGVWRSTAGSFQSLEGYDSPEKLHQRSPPSIRTIS